jgi:phosphate transport system protein
MPSNTLEDYDMATTSPDHIVSSYSDELTTLAQLIAEMGGQVEVAIENGTKALLKLDRELADVTIIADQRVDDMQRRIDDMAVSMIARRQPMASDLRAIVTSIHVASDLERVGDMAKQLARRSLKLEGLSLQPTFYNGVRNMTNLVLRQIKDALDAYASRDPAAAIEVCNRDDEVDAMHTSLFRELLTYMMEDPRNITQCTHLLFCAKSLERIGDHATNIAERAYYLQTGKQLTADVQELQRTQIKA